MSENLVCAESLDGVSSSNLTESSSTRQEEAPSETTTQSEVDICDGPTPKFRVRDRVYARDDQSSLLYPATVRRIMYGPQKQQLNVYEDLTPQDLPDCWHYFVHYQGWNVKWDRWVTENAVFVDNDGTRELAKQIMQVYKEMKKASKKKRGRVRDLDLKKRLKKLEEERRIQERKEQQGEDTKAIVAPKKSKQPSWDRERALRERLMENRLHSDLIQIPFPLKKILVDEWEIITQCSMVHALPCNPTVRQVLIQYLKSKLDMLRGTKEEDKDNNADGAVDTREDAGVANARSENITSGNEKEIVGAHNAARTGREEKQLINAPQQEPGEVSISKSIESIQAAETSSCTDTPLKSAGSTEDPCEVNESFLSKLDLSGIPIEQAKEWTDMAEGLVLFFDETLPVRLLYPQEESQYHALSNEENKTDCSMSDVYGCEFLLRLLVRLPAVVRDSSTMSEEEERQVYAKLGDLIRYLQKHRSTLFVESYQKPKQEDSMKGHAQKKRTGVKRSRASSTAPRKRRTMK